MPSLQ
jgi:hypothetical protein